MRLPVLYIVVPCFNEESVLPITGDLFVGKVSELIARNAISDESRVLFVNDGSRDATWREIEKIHSQMPLAEGASLSRNRGHQNALLAGLDIARNHCDIAISIDCDGQDDIGAMDEMINEYKNGADIVYGVRSDRETDTFFKKNSAQIFYRILKWLGAEIVYNHADYRLMSKRAIDGLFLFREVNLFLRGLVPMIGYRCSFVYYSRKDRMAGQSHYPLLKMLTFAWEGITSLSIKPIRIVTFTGLLLVMVSAGIIIWTLSMWMLGHVVPGWASIMVLSCLLGGVQIVCVGIIGEYVGKIYLESKSRPRYIIENLTINE